MYLFICFCCKLLNNLLNEIEVDKFHSRYVRWNTSRPEEVSSSDFFGIFVRKRIDM